MKRTERFRIAGPYHFSFWSFSLRGSESSWLACQAVESVNYRVHRLATVATQLAKWRCPSALTEHLYPMIHRIHDMNRTSTVDIDGPRVIELAGT